MKKFLLLVLSAMLILCLSACSIRESEEHEPSEDVVTEEVEEDVIVSLGDKIGDPNECESTKDIGGFSFYRNSASGIKVLWGGKNNTGKTINYYTVTFHFYNSVDDEAYSEITGKATKSLETVGPIEPGEDLLVCSIIDYVPTCDKVQIDQIELKYADGTSEKGWYGWYTTTENDLLR